MPPARRPATPYKFLAYYEPEDAGIFFGRETETEVLLSDIISTRLILLFAKTGSGKTSLIKAGVMPRLVELDYKPIYVRVEQDPLNSVRDELARKRLLPAKLRAATLDEQLRHVVTTLKKPVVLFFDQFEEFFIYIADEARRQELISSVARLYHDRGSAVHFVFSFREEFFIEMGAFRDRIPSIFHNNSNLRLKWFDLKQARDALVKPALKYDAEAEPELVTAVLGDLNEARGIEPARLQIICDTLWREKEKSQKERLSYTDYERLGRAQGILQRRLEEDIDQNLNDAQLRLFERMLPELRTRLGARTEYVLRQGQVFNEVLRPLKRGRTFNELLQALWPEDEDGRVGSGQDGDGEYRLALATLLGKLKGLHLLKEGERYDDMYFEWTSDYLADLTDSLSERVRALIVGRTLDAAIARAEEERAAFTEFGMDAEHSLAELPTEETIEALYMSAADFEAVTEGASLLGSLTPQQVRFLFAASLEHGTHMSLWFDKAKAVVGEEQVWQFVADRLSKEPLRIEQGWHTVELLGELGLRVSEEENALNYLKLALQQEVLALPAVHTLSRMRNPEAVSILASALESGRMADQIIDRLGEIRTAASVEALARSLERREVSARAEQVLESISKGRAGPVASLAGVLLQSWHEKRKERKQEALPEQAVKPRFKKIEWEALLYRLHYGQCTPIIGPGVSAGLAPLSEEIARTWAEKYNYPFEDSSNLARVAQFLSVTQDWRLPREQFAQLFRDSVPSGDLADGPHAVLASLPLPLYVTTTHDDLLLQALRKAGKDPRSEICRWHESGSYERYGPSGDELRGFEPTAAAPLVYHLYGHVSEPESIVLTEDDYITFAVAVLGDRHILPPHIRRAIADSAHLLVGHSPNDWGFRLLFSGLINRGYYRGKRYSSFCQLLPEPYDHSENSTDRQRHYLEQYFGLNGVRVYWGTAKSFMSELRQHFTERFPRDS